MTRFLTEAEIIAVNQYAIQAFSPGEQIGVQFPHLLDSALNRPKQSAFGQDAYNTISQKAAALFESLAQNHAFHSANKRSATNTFADILVPIDKSSMKVKDELLAQYVKSFLRIRNSTHARRPGSGGKSGAFVPIA